MADFTQVMTGTAQVDDSIILEFEAQFLLAQAEQGVADQFVSWKKDIGAKSISIPKYDHLALATTPLNEKEDVDSEALSDTDVLFTPAEYGNVVTTTKLANLQTGGKADLAAARLVGINAGRTQNRLALIAADGSSQVIFGDGTTFDTVTQAGIMSPTIMGKAFNLLARKNSVGLVNGDYIMIAHDDVIHDLREGTASGTWQDVHKYALPSEVLRNEVGMYKGFRVIRDNLSTIAANVGSVQVYNSYFMGFNALGKAMSQEVMVKLTGPFDKLGRFVNVGWHGVMQYGIVENDALVVARTASSLNA
jgi:N4-gp56 family major capsid protein